MFIPLPACVEPTLKPRSHRQPGLADFRCGTAAARREKCLCLHLPHFPPPQPAVAGTRARVFGWNLEENLGVFLSLGCPETPGLTKNWSDEQA